MPLKSGSSRETISENIREFHKGPSFAHTEGKFGKKDADRQAVAVALETARKTKRAKGGGVHIGPIDSNVPGRTDEHEMNVEDGSYVLPSETISHLGENNTEAGFEVAKRMFPDSGKRTIKIKRAKGGAVPVITAGGEFVVSRRDAERIGGGDLAHGHKILDQFVLNQRKKHIETLKALAGPAQD